MAHDKFWIKALIQLLSGDEGGRTKPIMGGTSYRPNHNFLGPDDRQMCMGAIDLPEGQTIQPGQSFETDMILWIWPALENEIEAGRKWRIQEGAKLVGFGTILEVLGSEMS